MLDSKEHFEPVYAKYPFWKRKGDTVKDCLVWLEEAWRRKYRIENVQDKRNIVKEEKGS